MVSCRARKKDEWYRFTDGTTMKSYHRAVPVVAMLLVAEACATQQGARAVHGRAVAVACVVSGDDCW